MKRLEKDAAEIATCIIAMNSFGYRVDHGGASELFASNPVVGQRDKFMAAVQNYCLHNPLLKTALTMVSVLDKTGFDVEKTYRTIVKFVVLTSLDLCEESAALPRKNHAALVTERLLPVWCELGAGVGNHVHFPGEAPPAHAYLANGAGAAITEATVIHPDAIQVFSPGVFMRHALAEPTLEEQLFVRWIKAILASILVALDQERSRNESKKGISLPGVEKMIVGGALDLIALPIATPLSTKVYVERYPLYEALLRAPTIYKEQFKWNAATNGKQLVVTLPRTSRFYQIMVTDKKSLSDTAGAAFVIAVNDIADQYAKDEKDPNVLNIKVMDAFFEEIYENIAVRTTMENSELTATDDILKEHEAFGGEPEEIEKLTPLITEARKKAGRKMEDGTFDVLKRISMSIFDILSKTKTSEDNLASDYAAYIERNMQRLAAVKEEERFAELMAILKSDDKSTGEAEALFMSFCELVLTPLYLILAVAEQFAWRCANLYIQIARKLITAKVVIAGAAVSPFGLLQPVAGDTFSLRIKRFSELIKSQDALAAGLNVFCGVPNVSVPIAVAEAQHIWANFVAGGRPRLLMFPPIYKALQLMLMPGYDGIAIKKSDDNVLSIDATGLIGKLSDGLTEVIATFAPYMALGDKEVAERYYRGFMEWKMADKLREAVKDVNTVLAIVKADTFYTHREYIPNAVIATADFRDGAGVHIGQWRVSFRRNLYNDHAIVHVGTHMTDRLNGMEDAFGTIAIAPGGETDATWNDLATASGIFLPVLQTSQKRGVGIAKMPWSDDDMTYIAAGIGEVKTMHTALDYAPNPIVIAGGLSNVALSSLYARPAVETKAETLNRLMAKMALALSLAGEERPVMLYELSSAILNGGKTSHYFESKQHPIQSHDNGPIVTHTIFPQTIGMPRPDEENEGHFVMNVGGTVTSDINPADVAGVCPAINLRNKIFLYDCSVIPTYWSVNTKLPRKLADLSPVEMSRYLAAIPNLIRSFQYLHQSIVLDEKLNSPSNAEMGISEEVPGHNILINDTTGTRSDMKGFLEGLIDALTKTYRMVREKYGPSLHMEATKGDFAPYLTGGKFDPTKLTTPIAVLQSLAQVDGKGPVMMPLFGENGSGNAEIAAGLSWMLPVGIKGLDDDRPLDGSSCPWTQYILTNAQRMLGGTRAFPSLGPFVTKCARFANMLISYNLQPLALHSPYAFHSIGSSIFHIHSIDVSLETIKKGWDVVRVGFVGTPAGRGVAPNVISLEGLYPTMATEDAVDASAHLRASGNPTVMAALVLDAVNAAISGGLGQVEAGRQALVNIVTNQGHDAPFDAVAIANARNELAGAVGAFIDLVAQGVYAAVAILPGRVGAGHALRVALAPGTLAARAAAINNSLLAGHGAHEFAAQFAIVLAVFNDPVNQVEIMKRISYGLGAALIPNNLAGGLGVGDSYGLFQTYSWHTIKDDGRTSLLQHDYALGAPAGVGDAGVPNAQRILAAVHSYLKYGNMPARATWESALWEDGARPNVTQLAPILAGFAVPDPSTASDRKTYKNWYSQRTEPEAILKECLGFGTKIEVPARMSADSNMVVMMMISPPKSRWDITGKDGRLLAGLFFHLKRNPISPIAVMRLIPFPSIYNYSEAFDLYFQLMVWRTEQSNGPKMVLSHLPSLITPLSMSGKHILVLLLLMMMASL